MEYKQISHARDLTGEELAAELVAARAALKKQEEVIWYLERAVAEATPDQMLGRIVVDSHDAKRKGRAE